MGVITLHGVDDDSLRRSPGRPKRYRHSLEDEAVSLLQDGLRERAKHRELVKRLDRIAAMTPKGVEQTDSVELLREDRDR